MEYEYNCVFCGCPLRKYEAITAEFPTLFESDMVYAGFTIRAPTRRISCIYPLYACRSCVVERSGILDSESTRPTT